MLPDDMLLMREERYFLLICRALPPPLLPCRAMLLLDTARAIRRYRVLKILCLYY